MALWTRNTVFYCLEQGHSEVYFGRVKPDLDGGTSIQHYDKDLHWAAGHTNILYIWQELTEDANNPYL